MHSLVSIRLRWEVYVSIQSELQAMSWTPHNSCRETLLTIFLMTVLSQKSLLRHVSLKRRDNVLTLWFNTTILRLCLNIQTKKKWPRKLPVGNSFRCQCTRLHLLKGTGQVTLMLYQALSNTVSIPRRMWVPKIRSKLELDHRLPSCRQSSEARSKSQRLGIKTQSLLEQMWRKRCKKLQRSN